MRNSLVFQSPYFQYTDISGRILPQHLCTQMLDLKMERCMTRYELLAEAAVKNSKAFFEDRQHCEHCARYIGDALRAYLEAPDGVVCFVVLDSELNLTTETHPQTVQLVRGADRRWHFCIQIYFGDNSSLAFSKVKIYFAIQRDGEGFRVFHEQNFHVKLEDNETLKAIAAHIFDGLVEDYAKPLDVPRPRIGF
jgi:hypothetical protein